MLFKNKTMSKIYAVLTFAKEDESKMCNSESEKDMIKIVDNIGKNIIVKEYGKNKDHPHYNILIYTQTQQKTTSYVRSKLKKIYEQKGIQCTKLMMNVKFADDIDKLFEYLFKEDCYEIINRNDEFKNIDDKEYHERAVKNFKIKKDKKEEYKVLNKNNFLEEFMMYSGDNIPNDYSDFVEILVDMKHNGYIISSEIKSKPGHFYADLPSNDADDQLRKILINNGNLN